MVQKKNRTFLAKENSMEFSWTQPIFLLITFFFLAHRNAAGSSSNCLKSLITCGGGISRFSLFRSFSMPTSTSAFEGKVRLGLGSANSDTISYKVTKMMMWLS
jgi:hypothetical protein